MHSLRQMYDSNYSFLLSLAKKKKEKPEIYEDVYNKTFSIVEHQFRTLSIYQTKFYLRGKIS